MKVSISIMQNISQPRHPEFNERVRLARTPICLALIASFAMPAAFAQTAAEAPAQAPTQAAETSTAPQAAEAEAAAPGVEPGEAPAAPVAAKAASISSKAADDTVVTLGAVVVSAAGFEQDIKNAPASITVITREELQERRYSSIAEALVNVEGIDVGNTMDKTGGLSISMRGMPSDYTLILIDGRRQNAAGNVTPNDFGSTSTTYMPPMAAIERIEIIRGPMSTLYGSDAMGGIVNIITRKVGRKWAGSLTIDSTFQENPEFGNTSNANIFVTGPLIDSKLGLTLRGSLFGRGAAALTPTGDAGTATISTRGPSPVRSDVHTLGARLMFTPNNKNDIWFDADTSRQTYDNGVGQLGTLDRPDASPPSFNGYGPELEFNRDQFTLAHTGRYDFGRWESTVMSNTTETTGRTIPPGTPGGPPGSGAPSKTPGSARTLEAENIVIDSKLVSSIGSHMFTVGGQWWEAKMVDGVALAPFEFRQWSLFVEDEWRFIDSMALTVGARHDDHDTFGGYTSPRAYLVWNTTEKLTLKGGYSKGFKTPRLEQLVDGITGFTGQGTTATIGTPTLKPETSASTEVGAYFDSLSGFTANITLFSNDFKDKIATGTPIPNCTFAGNPDAEGCVNYGDFPRQEFFNQSVNVDEAVTRGIEVATNIPIGKSWSLTANYTYTDSEQKSGAAAGFPLSNVPEHMVNTNLRWKATESLRLWLRTEYRSERARRLTAANNPAFNALGDFKGYQIFHLGGAFVVSQAVTINAAIYNLFDKDFLRFAPYANPTTALPDQISYTNLYNNLQEGRRLWLSANVSFGG